jgi:glutaminyl-peptide cyclotransferase
MMLALAQSLTPALRKKLEEDGNMPCLRMIFFDGEEAFVSWTDGPDGDSIYGSKHLASKWAFGADPYVTGAVPPRSRSQSMRALALLDLLGAARPTLTWHFESTRPLFSLMQDAEARAREQKLMKGAGGATTANYLSDNGNRGGISDDHLPWMNLGVPILHLIASPFPTVWHTVHDDLSALDYQTGDLNTTNTKLNHTGHDNLSALDYKTGLFPLIYLFIYLFAYLAFTHLFMYQSERPLNTNLNT